MKSILFVTLSLIVVASTLPIEETPVQEVGSSEARNILNAISISDAVQDDVVRQKRQFGGKNENFRNKLSLFLTL